MKTGNYVFRVKGSNSDGAWNEEGASIRITVTPPFWQTWWFFSLLGLAAAALILWWHWNRMKRLAGRMERKARIDYYLAQRNISSRELEIIHLIIEGRTNKEIEDVLFISSHTVKNHIYNIFKKLNVNSRLQLINTIRTSVK